MKIPESIKVGGRIYEVRFVNNLWRNTGNKGFITFNSHLIELDASLPEPDIGVVFIHEVIHAGDKQYGGNTLAEDKTDIVAETIYQVFSDMGIRFER